MKAKLGGRPNFARIESCTQDIPWNLHKLAQVARKHNLVDQALKYLNEADKNLRELNGANDYEHFFRVSETAKLAFKMNINWEETVEFLKNAESQPYCIKYPTSLSEVKRLRGEFFLRMRKSQDAYNEFTSATSICISNYRVWESLGLFCELGFEGKHQPRYNTHALKAYMHAAVYMVSKSKYFITKIFMCLQNHVVDDTENSTI